jgi:hypothetical protein
MSTNVENQEVETEDNLEEVPKQDTKSKDEAYAKRLREEARAERLAKVAAEKERDELKARIKEAEDKELAEQNKWKELHEKEKAARSEDKNKFSESLTKAERRYVLAEAKATAIHLGVLPEAIGDLKLLDFSDIKLDSDGEPVGMEEKIASIKTLKPHWFKSETQNEDTPTPKPGVPTPRKATAPKETDAYAMDDNAFEALRKSLGITRY